MAHFFTTTWTSPIGEIALAVDEAGALAALQFIAPDSLSSQLGEAPCITADTSHTALALAELKAYFSGKIRSFSTRVSPVTGTPYQRRIWAALHSIPYGETWSYTRLAAETGSMPRAVGAANSVNPISIVIPCHRVIGASGALVGYAGGLERKRYLLAHEGALLA